MLAIGRRHFVLLFFLFSDSEFLFFKKLKGFWEIFNKNGNDNKKDNKEKGEIDINQGYNLQNLQRVEKFNANAINGLQIWA